MSPDAQRIAIAEACGWTDIYLLRGIHPNGNIDEPTEVIPDYLHDLNAMHEAEKMLTDSQCQRHFDNLAKATGSELETRGTVYGVCHFLMYNATAAQRAEAFLRTLNLWTE